MTGRDKVTYFSLSTEYQRIFSLYLEYFGSANICHILGKYFFIKGTFVRIVSVQILIKTR